MQRNIVDVLAGAGSFVLIAALVAAGGGVAASLRPASATACIAASLLVGIMALLVGHARPTPEPAALAVRAEIVRPLAGR